MKNITIDESLHTEVKVFSALKKQTIQAFCEDALREKMEREKPK